MTENHTLLFRATAAPPEAVSKGLAAAQRVFVEADVLPIEAAIAIFKRDIWDDQGFPEESEPTQEDARLEDVWQEAEVAALRACFGDREPYEVDARLELIEEVPITARTDSQPCAPKLAI
jgi:hypothetical protein